MLETANALYFMIYGEELMHYHFCVSNNCWYISTYQVAQGKTEEAILSLEKMCKHAVAYEEWLKNDRGKNYTSIFTDKLASYSDSNNSELPKHSHCRYMLEHLKHNRYDPIRNDERFIVIEEKLKECAR